MAALAVAGVGDASLVVAGFAGLFPNAMIVTLPAAPLPLAGATQPMQSRLVGVCAWRLLKTSRRIGVRPDVTAVIDDLDRGRRHVWSIPMITPTRNLPITAPGRWRPERRGGTRDTSAQARWASMPLTRAKPDGLSTHTISHGRRLTPSPPRPGGSSPARHTRCGPTG
jgi:hypothetical protein